MILMETKNIIHDSRIKKLTKLLILLNFVLFIA